MKTFSAQSSFNAGVLSPKMSARYDLAQYYKGVSQGDNVIGQPQGGMIKRGGLELMGVISDALSGVTSCRMFAWQRFILVFYTYDAGSSQQGVRCKLYEGSTLRDTLDITAWLGAAAADNTNAVVNMKWALSNDGIIIVNEEYPPQLITLATATTIQTATITFSNIPQHDFNDSSSPAPTSAVWDLTLPGTTSGDTIRASIDGIQSEAFPISSVTAETAANIQLGFQQVLNNFISGEVTCAFKSGSTYTVTFANGAADDYDSVNLVPDVTAATPVSTAPNNTTTGVPRTEDVWSSTRGWPRTVCYHENRLVFGGSESRPQTIWMSRTGEYFDFKNYRSLDNESIEFTLDVDGSGAISNLISDRHLLIFTEDGEHYCPAIPVTPSNVAAPQQTKYGSKIYTDVVSVDNQVVFTQGGKDTIFPPTVSYFNRGGGVRSFVYTNDQRSYQSSSLSIMSDSLMQDPCRFDVSRTQEGGDAEYLYAIMEDGSCAVCNTIASEGVLSWTRFLSPSVDIDEDHGWFIDVATIDDDVYFLMQRDVASSGSSATTRSLEKLSKDTRTTAYDINFLDCFESTVTASTTTPTVNTYLNGFDVTVIDEVTGDVYEGLTVSGGQVTVPSAVTEYTVGLSYSPTIKSMPLNVSFQDGPHAGEPKRIVSVSCYLINSQAVTVNGEDIIWPVDDSTSGVTGRFDVRLSGWSTEAYVTISQSGPYPMNILDMIVEIDA